MTNQLTTPVITDLKLREQTIDLSVDLKLAGVPVTVVGTYYLDSNVYYPYWVETSMPMPDKDGELENKFDLEDFCETMGWEYYDTYDEIQAAVEER